VSAAVAELDAQRAAEEATRQQLILDSARAYLDILRDRGETELNRSNLGVLTELAAHVRAQQAVGQLTATDVAQAQSRRAAADAELRLAEARLASSRAGLRRLLGGQPPQLDEAWPLATVPATLSEALSLADSNPTLRAAAARAEAAAANRDAARAARWPLLSLQARAAHDYDSQFIPGSVDTWSMLLQVDVPLYEGGRLGAQARAAGAARERALAELADARAAVYETVERAWQRLQAATAVLDTVEAQIRAASLALDGVRAEAEVGQRTTLDVLDAERELLAARVAQLRARRDRSVAGLALKGAIGNLAVDDLKN
jgi:outer membrane protein